MALLTELPINFKLSDRYFRSNATNRDSVITVSIKPDLVDASYKIPSESISGLLYNDGSGVLKWEPVADFGSVIEVNNVSTDGTFQIIQDGTGDCDIYFQTVSSAYMFGIDNSVDKFKLSKSAELGTDDILTIDGNIMQLTSDSILTTGMFYAEQLGTGDSSIHFSVPAADYMIGIDNSDSDKFKISNSTSLGTSDIVTIASTGVEITGDLNVSGTISGNMIHDVTTINGTVTLDDTYTVIRVADTLAASYNITLPASGTYAGIEYKFVRIDFGTTVNIIINPAPGTDEIDNGITSIALSAEHARVTLVDVGGGRWYTY